MKTNTLSRNELQHLLSHIKQHQFHSERDRLIVLMTFMAGMTPSDISKIKVSDVLTKTGSIVHRADFSGKEFEIAEKLRCEIKTYLLFYYDTDSLFSIANINTEYYLFYTQKRGYFSPNTLSNYLYNLYSNAGIKGSAITGKITYNKNLADHIHNAVNQQSMDMHLSY